MANIKKVTMGLTEQDIQNVAVIERLTNARSKAQAVSNALNVATEILETLANMKDGELVIQSKNGGEYKRVIFIPSVAKVSN